MKGCLGTLQMVKVYHQTLVFTILVWRWDSCRRKRFTWMRETNNNLHVVLEKNTLLRFGVEQVCFEFWPLARERRKVIYRWGGNRLEWSIFGESLSKSPGWTYWSNFEDSPCQSETSTLSLLFQIVTSRSKSCHLLGRKAYLQSIFLETTKCLTGVSGNRIQPLCTWKRYILLAIKKITACYFKNKQEEMMAIFQVAVIGEVMEAHRGCFPFPRS